MLWTGTMSGCGTNLAVVSLQKVNESWNSLVAPSDMLYSWDPKSTYIKSPPFFDSLVNHLDPLGHTPVFWKHDCHLTCVPCLPRQSSELQPPKSIVNAHVLLNLGDSVTTDHISPAGNIARTSAAARYLTSRG